MGGKRAYVSIDVLETWFLTLLIEMGWGWGSEDLSCDSDNLSKSLLADALSTWKIAIGRLVRECVP
jgi:hypothetical protein